MTILPDIPRLYTALAEWLACLMYVVALRRRFGSTATILCAAGWLAGLSAFLQLTGNVPLAWWIPCMAAAVALMYAFLYLCCSVNAKEAGYCCARAFILAEFAASLEWQIHCLLWPRSGAWAPQSLLLLAVIYAAVYGFVYRFEFRRVRKNPELGITRRALVSAIIMALAAFLSATLRLHRPARQPWTSFTSARWWTWRVCWCCPSSRSS